MRRKDREITDQEEIYQILQKCNTIRIGMQGEFRPYVVPVSFGTERTGNLISIFFHCAREGKKIDMILEHPDVCVEGDLVYKIDKTENSFTAYYESVIGFGKCTFLQKQDEIIHGLGLILEHYGYRQDQLARCYNLEKVTVGKITLEEITGKRNSPFITKKWEDIEGKDIIIRKITNTETILSVMKECDYAFPRSFIYRDNFPVIYEKITNNADFYGAFYKKNENEKCLGYAAVYANDHESKKAYITLICVKPEMQGFHVGTKLINKCFQVARERGMKTVRLEVLTNNHQAISFYQHHGFSVESYTNEGSIYMIKDL